MSSGCDAMQACIGCRGLTARDLAHTCIHDRMSSAGLLGSGVDIGAARVRAGADMRLGQALEGPAARCATARAAEGRPDLHLGLNSWRWSGLCCCRRGKLGQLLRASSLRVARGSMDATLMLRANPGMPRGTRAQVIVTNWQGW